jgi:hypothetical protein
MRSLGLVPSLAATVMLVGCTEYLDRRETVSFGAGNAQQANLITHVISPLPSHAADRDLLFDGDRVGSGVERYRNTGNAGEKIAEASEDAAADSLSTRVLE